LEESTLFLMVRPRADLKKEKQHQGGKGGGLGKNPSKSSGLFRGRGGYKTDGIHQVVEMGHSDEGGGRGEGLGGEREEKQSACKGRAGYGIIPPVGISHSGKTFLLWRGGRLGMWGESLAASPSFHERFELPRL